jgi:WD40 repeat protein
MINIIFNLMLLITISISGYIGVAEAIDVNNADNHKDNKPVISAFEYLNTIYSVALNSDSKYALSTSMYKDTGNIMILWDLTHGNVVKIFVGHDNQVTSVAFSPNGKYALSGSVDNTLKLWDISSGKEIRTFKGHDDAVQSVAFSPDGKYALSGSDDNTLKLWDISSGKEIRSFIGHKRSVVSVAFSSDGNYALSGSWDKTLKLWDISSGRNIQTFTGHSEPVQSAVFSPDGKYALSGSWDNTVKLWDISTGEEIRNFTGHSSWVRSVAFSPDGKYAVSAGCEDKTLKLWEISSGKEIRTITGHDHSIMSVSFSSDGRRILSGSDDGTVRLWSVSNGKEIAKFYYFIDGEWAIITPESYYNSSENGDKHLNVHVGDAVYNINSYRKDFYQPAQVKIALSSDKKLPQTHSLKPNTSKITKRSTSTDKPIKEFSGNGLQTTRPFTVKGGWEIQWDSKGEILQISVYKGTGEFVGLVSNQMGPGTGSAYQPKGGTYYLQANAMGDWSIKIVKVK